MSSPSRKKLGLHNTSKEKLSSARDQRVQCPYDKEHAGERTEQKVDVMVEQKKMFFGATEMFSAPVIKKLSCHATEMVQCQYMSCSDAGSSQ